MTARQRREWGLGLVGLVVVVIVLTAARGAEAILTTERVAAAAVVMIGSWALYTAQQFFRRLKYALEKTLPRIEDGLWGPQDREGKRTGGLVGDMQLVKASCEEFERLSRERQARTRKGNRRGTPHDRDEERRSEVRDDG